MKKLLLSLIGCMLAGASIAQTQTGQFYTGAHIGGIIKKDNSSKTTIINLNPTAGYFINSKWMVGVKGGYSISKSESQKDFSLESNTGYSRLSTGGEVISKTWSVGPLVRYFIPVSGRISFFIEDNIGLAGTDTKVVIEPGPSFSPVLPETGDVKVSPDMHGNKGILIVPQPLNGNGPDKGGNSFYANLAPGLVYFPTTKIGIELKVNMLNYTKYQDKGHEMKADFSLANTTIGAGLYF